MAPQTVFIQKIEKDTAQVWTCQSCNRIYPKRKGSALAVSSSIAATKICIQKWYWKEAHYYLDWFMTLILKTFALSH